MKKIAFTLIELSVCMIIIGFIAITVINNHRNNSIEEKAFLPKARKTISALQNASQQIRLSSNCPTKNFIIESLGTWHFALMNSDETATADIEDIIEMYGYYMKYQNSSINFCDYTDYCSDSNIKGAKLPDGTYIGFELYNTIKTCPNYIIPENTTNTTGKGMCWGAVYLDTNGKNKPNTLGKDVYMFGLGEYGLIY